MGKGNIFSRAFSSLSPAVRPKTPTNYPLLCIALLFLLGSEGELRLKLLVKMIKFMTRYVKVTCYVE